MSFTFVLTRRISHLSNYLVPRKHIRGSQCQSSCERRFRIREM